MTIQQAYQQLRSQLFSIYDESEAGNIAELVVENIFGWKKTARMVDKTSTLDEKQQALLEDYTRALLMHTPLQYVLKEAWFYGMLLYVDENVLIPRPETEELVDWIIKDVKRSEPESIKSALDIGTGSGCIPIAIKKNILSIEMHACDISSGALEVAQKNTASQQLNINFHQLDILSPTDRFSLPAFDIIISNPPYIPEKDKKEMSANVLQFEPSLALFVADSDPLLFYRTIADFAATHLKNGGFIYLEIHEVMGKAIVDLYRQKGFTDIELRKDLQGKDRMLRVAASY